MSLILAVSHLSRLTGKLRIAALLAVLALALPIAAACSDSGDGGSDATSTPAASGSETPGQGGGSASAPSIRSEDGLTTVQIVDKLAPSIVRVQTEGATIDQFGRVAPSTGIGTGVIIDTDGHIVTNNHVVTAGTGD
ncbi:MAG TPA: hypothetical protein VFH62_00305, partial [Dehalococcoidia bacterium]|nr:hypothetical protein [Dehalococcoidia bacterium]